MVGLPTARHVANIVSLPLTATALLYKPWDVSAALSLLLVRKPAVKFASAIYSSVLGSRLLVPFFALRWILVAATAPSPRTRPRRTILACEGALLKVPGLPKSRLQMPALALFIRRTNLPKSLPSRASAQSRAALRANLSRNLFQRATVPTFAVRMTRLSKKPPQKLGAAVLAPMRTCLPRL